MVERILRCFLKVSQSINRIELLLSKSDSHEQKTEDPTHRLAHCNEKVSNTLKPSCYYRLIFMEKYNKQDVLFNILWRAFLTLTLPVIKTPITLKYII